MFYTWWKHCHFYFRYWPKTTKYVCKKIMKSFRNNQFFVGSCNVYSLVKLVSLRKIQWTLNNDNHVQGVQTKLSRTLGPHCGWTNYHSSTCSINSESYTYVLSIFNLVVVMPSSYEDLEGYKWEEVYLRSAADFMNKLPQSPWLLLRPQLSYSHG